MRFKRPEFSSPRCPVTSGIIYAIGFAGYASYKLLQLLADKEAGQRNFTHALGLPEKAG